MHPDGTARELVADGTALPRSPRWRRWTASRCCRRLDPYSDLTGTKQLLVFDIATRRTVEVSRGTRTVSYNGGMLWWSTGAREAPVWHAVDLRTV